MRRLMKSALVVKMLLSLMLTVFAGEAIAQEGKTVSATAGTSTVWPVVTGLPGWVNDPIKKAEKEIAGLAKTNTAVTTTTTNLETTVKSGQRKAISSALDALDETQNLNNDQFHAALDAIIATRSAFLDLVLKEKATPEQIRQFKVWVDKAFAGISPAEGDVAMKARERLYRKATDAIYASVTRK